jgi:SAP domain-containing ribonucleoprotein
MVEYAKMKNAELEALLKERGLPHSGKKAELVARLQEDDKKNEPGSTKPAAEDEIDWDEDATAPQVAKPAAPAASSQPTAQAAKPSTTSNAQATAPSTDAQAAPASATETATEAPAELVKEKTPVDFSIGLATTTIEDEIEKRKARAKKFGIPDNDPVAEEALKRLERAQKFGESGGPAGLNEALPERRAKRGREGGEDHGDFKRRGGRGFRGGRGGGRRFGRRPPAQESRPNEGYASWMSDKDKAAADARKARFAA